MKIDTLRGDIVVSQGPFFTTANEEDCLGYSRCWKTRMMGHEASVIHTGAHCPQIVVYFAEFPGGLDVWIREIPFLEAKVLGFGGRGGGVSESGSSSNAYRFDIVEMDASGVYQSWN
jgi:hypothetical protein